MNEVNANAVRSIEDLRPAPRTTPTPVLWLMFIVVSLGITALLWPSDEGTGREASTGQKQLGSTAAAAASSTLR